MKENTNNKKGDSKNLMAIGRTILANERTLLAFLRTSLGFFLGGIALIKYMHHPVIVSLGWSFLALALVLLVWGLYRYRHVRKVLRVETPEDQMAVGKEMGL